MLSGHFTYYDILSPDPAASARFYTMLCGWAAKRMETGDPGGYHQFFHGDTAVGGVVAHTAGGQQPTAWVGYVTTSDLDASLVRAAALGGRKLFGPVAIPRGGRFAYVLDPTGGLFAALQPGPGAGADPTPTEGPGWFVWNELGSTEVEGALAFYRALFGWSAEGVDMGGSTYHLCSMGQTQVAGLYAQQPGMPTAWLHAVSTDDVDRSCGRVQELGGAVVMPPMDIPGIGRYAVVTDNVGAAFSLYKRA